MSERWNWFYELVQIYLAPVLDEFKYVRLTSPEYVLDENITFMTVYFYENLNGEKISVDMLTYEEGDVDNLVSFYLIRVDIGHINLKQHVYPNSTDRGITKGGWKCYTNESVTQALKEIAVELKRFLT